MRSIHPQNSVTIASIVLEICTRQKSNMKINTEQKLKNKASKSYGSCALHSPLMRSIHPQNFITITSIFLGDMHRTKIKYENKQRAITKKKASESYGSCALHSLFMRSIDPQNFITIASTVSEICSGQNSSMKIDKGQ